MKSGRGQTRHAPLRQVPGVALALAMLLPGGAAPAQQEAPAPAGRITIVAEGRVAAVPDMATVTLGVERSAATAAEASAAMSEAAGALLAALEASGLPERDLSTTSLSLAPQRAPRGPDGAPGEITGYTAATLVTVQVRALDGLGGLLDTAIGTGANRLQGLSFGLSDPEPLMDEARRRAVAEARRRAALYAEAAGVALGPLVTLAEEGGMQPRPFAARADMALAQAAAMPVATGEVTLSATVLMTYALAP